MKLSFEEIMWISFVKNVFWYHFTNEQIYDNQQEIFWPNNLSDDYDKLQLFFDNIGIVFSN